jgi:hypothetical protein
LSDSDPERTVAQHIVPSFGGRIVLRVPSKADSRPDYLSRRQMHLFDRD